MSESHRTKNLSERHKDCSKTKDPQTGCIPHGRKGLAHGLMGSWAPGLAQCKSSCEEHDGYGNNLSKGIKIVSLTKGP